MYAVSAEVKRLIEAVFLYNLIKQLLYSSLPDELLSNSRYDQFFCQPDVEPYRGLEE